MPSQSAPVPPACPERPLGQHAVVIGSGIAGLLAARVLSEHFAHVSVLDADPLDPSARPRAGTPQSQHAQLVWDRGQELLRGWFPSLPEELRSRGAATFDMDRELRIATTAGLLVSPATGVVGFAASRALLESALRGQLHAIENVSLRAHTRVTGPLWSRGRVAGVSVCLSRGTRTQLAADLVVDASGSGCSSAAWLAPAGFAEPELSVMRTGLQVATRDFILGDAPAPEWRVALVAPEAPKLLRGGLASMVERQRWQVSLYAYGELPPAARLPDFVEFAAELAHPSLLELLERARPVGPARSMVCSPSVRRHFERLKRYPDGWLALGDSLCSSNPVHAQGVTLAAEQARVLAQVLEELRLGQTSPGGLVERYFRRVSEAIEPAWRWAGLCDLSVPGVEPDPPKDHDVLARSLARLRVRATKDAAAAVRLRDVLQLRRPLQSAFESSEP